tara:strand:- start:258 stop:1502 length:1245 start_codon:yes stop_codon:yes gene_type:complete
VSKYLNKDKVSTLPDSNLIEKYKKSNICHLPWTGIEVTETGQYKPCCLYKHPLKDKNKQALNTVSHSIDEVFESQDMIDLRNQFSKNQKPTGCERCWKEEESGKTSLRMLSWEKSSVLGEYHVKKNITASRTLGLKLGNTCNLKCRICGPEASSQWVNELIKEDPTQKTRLLDLSEKTRWPRKKNKLFDSIESSLKDIRYLQITGGEPFMIKEQFDMLEKCVELGVADKIDVHYNTNGTHYPEQALKNIWPHFKRIEIGFSIDGINQRFEYQRHPAVWDEVDSNIKRISTSGLKNLSTQISTTINLFSIYYLDELAEKVDAWNPDYWHINCLHNPKEFDIQALPVNVKESISQKLEKCRYRKNEIQTAIQYLNQHSKNTPTDLAESRKKKIISTDNIRNESFEKVFPELYDLIW